MGIARCDRCVFWSKWSDSEGDCRRYPPTVFLVSADEHKECHPFTSDKDWCGEFKEDVNKKFQDMPYEELDFGRRALNTLSRLGVVTVSDITTLSMVDILNAKACGESTLCEILAQLRRIGLKLRD